MAPKAEKPAVDKKKKATPTKSADGKVKRTIGKARNYDLGNGVYRFSRSRMYHKKALYKFVQKKVAPAKKPTKSVTFEKKIKGEKNGSTRVVLVRKRKNYYPTQDK